MSNGNIPEIPDFAEKAIENVLDEPTKAMGSTFADIWFLALGGPIGQLAQKRRIKYAYDLKLFKQKTEEEISKIPQEKRLEADIQIVGPILEAAKYCAEKEQLRNMFSKLIASTMDADRGKMVHPIFSDIISKMTSLDATIFEAIATNTDIKCDHVTKEQIVLSLFTLRQLGIINVPELFHELNHDERVKNILDSPLDVMWETVKSINDMSTGHFLESAMRYMAQKNPEIIVKECFLTKLGRVLKNICID